MKGTDRDRRFFSEERQIKGLRGMRVRKGSWEGRRPPGIVFRRRSVERRGKPAGEKKIEIFKFRGVEMNFGKFQSSETDVSETKKGEDLVDNCRRM